MMRILGAVIEPFRPLAGILVKKGQCRDSNSLKFSETKPFGVLWAKATRRGHPILKSITNLFVIKKVPACCKR
ncbi:protein of unknown function [Legionella hackeliae]|uniref:Uncharacterized protein n=1 Tax=Legionella hackeliae TaxID=449 RepID=A0A0A8UQ52_LEGHA|nr:protein of unknown function [Legionella hackeliae]